MTLAPVADVGRPGSALAARTFPGGPRRVADSVAAAVRAYRAGGVGATAKHFPGLGAATSNTDHAPASVRLTPTDVEPFKAAIAAGVPLVMASHALYPNVDRRNLASQSPALLRDLLRGRLRYRGDGHHRLDGGRGGDEPQSRSRPPPSARCSPAPTSS